MRVGGYIFLDAFQEIHVKLKIFCTFQYTFDKKYT